MRARVVSQLFYKTQSKERRPNRLDIQPLGSEGKSARASAYITFITGSYARNFCVINPLWCVTGYLANVLKGVNLALKQNREASY